MLETLVSSRIRRTLLEHIVLHPDARFYLRGLAKELHLSVTPLRRELKRLEASGILRPDHEGNIVFYTVNTNAAEFLRIKHAGMGLPGSSEAMLPMPPLAHPQTTSFQDRQPITQSIPISATLGESRQSWWDSPLRGPVLVGMAGLSLLVMLLIVGAAYVTITHEQWLSRTAHLLSTHKTEVTVVAPTPSTSGVMHGNRWRIVPGGFGGFSSNNNNSESY